MATNPRIYPLPWPVPLTGPKVWGPGKHTGNSTTGIIYFPGMRVMGSLDGDASIEYLFPMPSGDAPAGDPYLVFWAICDDVSHDAKVEPLVATAGDGDNPSETSLTSEGTQTFSWGASDDHNLRTFSVLLDAVPPVPGEWYLLRLKFKTSGWTLDQTSTWQVWIEYIP